MTVKTHKKKQPKSLKFTLSVKFPIVLILFWVLKSLSLEESIKIAERLDLLKLFENKRNCEFAVVIIQ